MEVFALYRRARAAEAKGKQLCVPPLIGSVRSDGEAPLENGIFRTGVGTNETKYGMTAGPFGVQNGMVGDYDLREIRRGQEAVYPRCPLQAEGSSTRGGDVGNDLNLRMSV